MNKKVKDLTSDAIFIALVTVIILVMKYFLSMLDSMILLLLSLFIGIMYHKAPIIRPLLVSLSIFLLSFLYFDILSILIYIVPGLVLGLISHFLLKIILNVPYYLSTILIYFIVHSLIELLYSKVILNINFKDYLLSGMEFPKGMVEKLGLTGLLILFFGYNLFMAFLESVILRKSVFIYEIKIRGKKK